MDKRWEDELIIKAIIPTLVTRKEWRALKTKKIQNLNFPVRKLVFSNTNTRPCYSKDHCIHDLRKYQQTILEGGAKDLPFNFLIGKDGNVYEGTGWKCQPDNIQQHKAKAKGKKGHNEGQINIAFINDKDLKPSMVQIKRAMGLIIQGIKNKYVSDKIKILKDANCQHLFSISDFHNTMLGLLGLAENAESGSEDSDADSVNKYLTEERRIEEPFKYAPIEKDDPDDAEYMTIKSKIREDNPDFL